MKMWVERGGDGFFLPYVDYLARTEDGTSPVRVDAMRHSNALQNWTAIYTHLAALRDVVNNTNL